MAYAGVKNPAITLDDEIVSSYRKNGFAHVPGVLSAHEVAYFQAAAEREHGVRAGLEYAGKVFKQIIQVWKDNDELRELTLDPRIASLATQLAGGPMRLWHDQLLVKEPHNGAPTEFHQDGPYWSHLGTTRSLSCWIALTDVPVEKGCMSFIPGQHERRDLRPIDLLDKTDLFVAAPDLTWEPRVTIPLRAGDVTFHSAWTPHTANRNDTDEYRWAHVTIYMDRDATYSGKAHPVTDPLGLAVGDSFPDDEFPPFS